MASVFLSLGSNLGDRKKSLEKALSLIEDDIGEVLSKSGIYETDAWDYKSENMFLNMAICITTSLLPEALLADIKKIEGKMGRQYSKVGYSDRPIDIDIIFYDDLIISTPEITIPHPHMASRRFVLQPLSDIAPDLIHPVLKKSVQTLLNKLA